MYLKVAKLIWTSSVYIHIQYHPNVHLSEVHVHAVLAGMPKKYAMIFIHM